MKFKLHAFAALAALSSFGAMAADNIQVQDSAASTQESISDQRTTKFKPIVLPFYDPSVDAGIMAVPLIAFYPDDNDLVSDASTIAFPMFYTSSESYITKVAADIILFEDKFRFRGEGGFASTNLDLMGVGTNKEEFDLDADFYYKVFDDIYVGIGCTWKKTRYNADDSSDQGKLTGMGFSDQYGTDTGARISMLWDTREHYYNSRGGFMWDLRYETHAEWLGNDADNAYDSIFTDYRHYISIDDNPDRVIATKLVGRYLIDAENAPSSAHTTFGRQGKEVQRGFVLGDYVAANMVSFEAEYKHALSDTGNAILDKSVLVAIGGAGKSFGMRYINGQPVDEKFKDSDWLGMVGVGYQYEILPYERINIRADVTYNTDGEVIAYFGVGQSI
ncbi:BamA/TamA family outer membrane protein [Vibrio crassostreae]|uniref:BamA/TamA family outer membrane protein n=1 Tax=Vibrio crassostreae TaxID=246167 RepID=UPI001B303C0A|nr:BamA/TamA family outer membrane protein [Vibrio crassostreae]